MNHDLGAYKTPDLKELTFLGGHRPKTINKYMCNIYQFGIRAKKENEGVKRRIRLTRGVLFEIW